MHQAYHPMRICKNQSWSDLNVVPNMHLCPSLPRSTMLLSVSRRMFSQVQEPAGQSETEIGRHSEDTWLDGRQTEATWPSFHTCRVSVRLFFCNFFVISVRLFFCNFFFIIIICWTIWDLTTPDIAICSIVHKSSIAASWNSSYPTDIIPH